MPPIVAVTGFVVQAIATVVTFAVAVPVLLVAVHVCAGFVGCVFTSTSYAPVHFRGERERHRAGSRDRQRVRRVVRQHQARSGQSGHAAAYACT